MPSSLRGRSAGGGRGGPFRGKSAFQREGREVTHTYQHLHRDSATYFLNTITVQNFCVQRRFLNKISIIWSKHFKNFLQEKVLKTDMMWCSWTHKDVTTRNKTQRCWDAPEGRFECTGTVWQLKHRQHEMRVLLKKHYMFFISSGTTAPSTLQRITEHIFLKDYIPKVIPDTIWLLENFCFRDRPISMTSNQLPN